MHAFRKKVIVQLGISLGLVMLFGGLLMYVYSDLKTVGESIEREVGATVKRTQEIESLSALRRDAASAQVMMNQLRNVLPNRESLFIFPEEVSRLARERNLTLNFSFGNELLSASPTAPHKVDFMIGVEGERDQIISFLNALELSRYFTRVTSLEFLSQGIDTITYRATLSGEVFFSE